MVTQKELERTYLDEARRLSSIFPVGEPLADSDERPDFLFARPSGTLGIEMTELCRSAPRAEAARLAKVAPRAKALYARFTGAHPVNVSPVFSQYAKDIKTNVLAESLAEFVYRYRNSDENIHWTDVDDVPEGFLQIGVFPGAGEWRYFRLGDTELATYTQVADRIMAKNQLVPDYRKRASEIWLLIVSDQFLGTGEVYVRPDDRDEWSFNFDFDKVLLFTRWSSRSGQVVELSRNSAPAPYHPRSQRLARTGGRPVDSHDTWEDPL